MRLNQHKKLAWCLAIAWLVATAIGATDASYASLPRPTDSAESPKPDPAKAVTTSEQVDKRTVDSKTFNTDQPGVQKTDVYGAPIHTKNSRGEWVDIDGTLVTRDGFIQPAVSPLCVRVQ